jgi:Beta-propeller repeat
MCSKTPRSAGIAVGASALLLSGTADFAAGTALRVQGYGHSLPLAFEWNEGQTRPEVRMLGRAAGYSVYLTATEIVFALPPPAGAARRAPSPVVAGTLDGGASTPRPSIVRMRLVGASQEPRITTLAPLPGRVNYMIGSDATRWHRGVGIYAAVRYQGVYPGIDVVYRGAGGDFEYDFVLAAGADPARIVIEFDGVDDLDLTPDGQLLLRVAGGVIRHRRPVVHEGSSANGREVDGHYTRLAANRVGFATAASAVDQALVIDPVVSFATYLGGDGIDQGLALAVDRHGSAYVAGQTWSPAFPTSGAWQAIFAGGGVSGGGDAFVTKLDSTGSSLVYSTYLGGDSGDSGEGIALGADGSAYVVGTTQSADFPTTATALATRLADAGPDVFVAKLGPSGDNLVYSTYVGGRDYDAGHAIAVDRAGAAYITGTTLSNDWPTSHTAPQAAQGGNADVFVAKLDGAGSTLLYSTYLGGKERDSGNAIAVDAAGDAFVTGETASLDFPTSPAAFQTSMTDSGAYRSDAFVTKLDRLGRVILFSTYVGGSGIDTSAGIALDHDNRAVVVGGTRSTDFPTTLRAFRARRLPGDAGADAFVTKLDESGRAQVFSTYLGGASDDAAHGVALDLDDDVSVIGSTVSRDFPTTEDAAQDHLGDDGSFPQLDAFVTKLHSAGTALVYSSYLGGGGTDESGGSDRGTAIAIGDSGRDVYIAGVTSSHDFPTTHDVAQFSLGGLYDAFVAKIQTAP